MVPFVSEHSRKLSAFARMSQTAGARADYVQGGGGNTSVKLDGGLMAIKASGYKLRDVREDAAYAVMDGGAVRAFYLSHEPSDFADVEAGCAAYAKEQTKEVDGLKSLRPSVEAGFHSLLDTYVLHSHSVWANLAACSAEGPDILKTAFADLGCAWAWIPYVNPGARLTFSIRDEMSKCRQSAGSDPAVLILQNHGIVVHGNDPDSCLRLHEDASARIASLFGLSADGFPDTGIGPEGDGFVSAGEYVPSQMKSGAFPLEDLLAKPLYPDQQVFFTGVLGEKAVVAEDGRVHYAMGADAAKTVEETLAAVTFIISAIKKAGYTLRQMGESDQSFIANWDSEKYRKRLSENS